MTYSATITKIKKILNDSSRGGKRPNSQENFLNLLKELKEGYGIEVSKDFLFNLMNSKRKPKQKRQKINDLLRGVVTYELNKYSRPIEFITSKVDIKEYGINKWGETCVKKSRVQEVEREFIKPIKKILEIIKV